MNRQYSTVSRDMLLVRKAALLASVPPETLFLESGFEKISNPVRSLGILQSIRMSHCDDDDDDDRSSHFPRIQSSLLDDDGKAQNSSKEEVAAIEKSDMHWILHWDINETILVGDPVGGDSCEDCYNKIIAKSSFVQMPRNKEDDADNEMFYDYDNTSSMVPTHWWDGTPIDSNMVCPPPALYTGWKWPKGCCPYYRTSYKTFAKAFSHNNQHGSNYRPVYEDIKARMEQQHSDDSKALPSVFQNILPAFFHTIYNMVHKNFANKSPPITVVFRTFGTDLPGIAKAMTAFAQGKHPYFPDFVHPEYELPMDRLYNAKWVPIATSPGSDTGKYKEAFQYQLFRQDDGSMVASGDEQVLKLLHDPSNGYASFGVRDDYSMWKDHNWEPWAGKPVWTADNSKHHHLLLDDNIHNLPHDGIASVRQRHQSPSSEELTYYESLSGFEIQAMHGVHLIRVPTIEPILNVDWFLQQIRKVQTEVLAAQEQNS